MHALVRKKGIVAQYIVADLSRPSAAEQVFEESRKRRLAVDLLVNNAGIGSSGEFAKDDLQANLKMLQLNNDSLVMLCRLFLPEMIGHRSGSIVNVGSLASFFPSPYMALCAASKMFVRSFTQALTEECRPYGVHVMLFCPGLTTTNFMNTAANDNDWGKILVEGAYTQTSDQVALEMIQALDKKKTMHISGISGLDKGKRPNLHEVNFRASRKRYIPVGTVLGSRRTAFLTRVVKQQLLSAYCSNRNTSRW